MFQKLLFSSSTVSISCILIRCNLTNLKISIFIIIFLSRTLYLVKPVFSKTVLCSFKTGQQTAKQVKWLLIYYKTWCVIVIRVDKDPHQNVLLEASQMFKFNCD